MSFFYTVVEKYGNNLLYRGWENGKRVAEKIAFEPKLFLKTDSQNPHYVSLVGKKPLKVKSFENTKAMRDFIETYKEVTNFEIFGTSNVVSQYIQERFPGKIEYDEKLISTFFYDIETDSVGGYADVNTADKQITAISIKSSKLDTYFLLGLKGFDKTKTISGVDPEDIVFIEYDNEIDMLHKFISIWKQCDPDIISGWNVEFYDVQYVITRIMRIIGEDVAKSLSPWGLLKKVSVEKFGREQHTYHIYGIAIIDYMDAFKKFGYKYGPQNSYKLDNIAHVVLGEKKLSYEEYGNLANLWVENPQLYLDYALKDTKLLQRLEDEAGLISLVITMAYSSGCNYSDTFGTVGIWETILYRRLMEISQVPPLRTSPGDRSSELVGGYVKDPQLGMHEWLVSLDLNSLYPHIMLQYNMGIDTILNDREDVNVDMVLEKKFFNEDATASVCANGVKFTNEFKGIIPTIIEEYYARRKQVKKEMLHHESIEQEIKAELKKRGIEA